MSAGLHPLLKEAGYATATRREAVPAFVGWNLLCEGGISEVLKRALVLLLEAYRSQHMRSRVTLDMHDALILEIAHDEWDGVLQLATGIMENVTPESLNERTTPPI